MVLKKYETNFSLKNHPYPVMRGWFLEVTEFEEEKKWKEIEILQKEKDKLEIEIENLKAKIDDMKLAKRHI